MQQFQEQILFQHTTSTDGNEFMWQCPEYYTALIHSIVIANITAVAITYRLLVNPNKKTFTVNNSLGNDIPIAGNATDTWIDLGGVMYPTSFGIRSSTAEAIVVTCFGTLMKTG